MIGELLCQIVAAFLACAAFSIIYNVPKSELFYCGLCGAVGWGVLMLICGFGEQNFEGTFCAAVAVTALARFLSYARKAPSTLYHIAGILPLVPGMGMYNTMWGILNDDMLYSYSQGVNVFRLAGVIGLGSLLVLALPYSTFELIKFKPKEKPVEKELAHLVGLMEKEVGHSLKENHWNEEQKHTTLEEPLTEPQESGKKEH